jgi:two-component system, LytTR family, sensor kinase
MKGREKKYTALLRGIFLNKYLYFHTGYWIFYVLFFTVQRFAFYGYADFVPNLKLNLAYLPNVLIFTYFITEYVIPRLLSGNKLLIPSLVLILIILAEPGFAYLIRSYFIEPYIYNDHRIYTLYNYLTAILIFVFGIVPIAGLKIASLLRSEYLHRQKVEHDKLEAELKLKESELKLLKGQIEPHFLFNTLNNLYALALEKSDKIPDLVLRLSDMLSYITYECNSEKISLSKEIEFMNSYIELQKLRYDTCKVSIRVSGNLSDKQIAPMILHTFIDNSFKHGVENDTSDPWIKIAITVKGNLLFFAIINSKKQISNNAGKMPGIGINNAVKRLDLIYPGHHDLVINNSDKKFSVYLKLEL